MSFYMQFDNSFMKGQRTKRSQDTLEEQKEGRRRLSLLNIKLLLKAVGLQVDQWDRIESICMET